VLENQEPIDNDASKKAKTLRMLGIDANAAPENEFDDCSALGTKKSLRSRQYDEW
jgi:hypothetical protein